MEGPSLYLASEQLQPFKKRQVKSLDGNTKIDKERMREKDVEDIFAWGKHLVFQFDTFALRTHFMLFGTFEAEVNGISVTGDYRKTRVPRLVLTFDNGAIHLYNCSLKYSEDAHVRALYDFTIDIMSPTWDKEKALAAVTKQPKEEIADILLDQDIFAGVGNIIKNEVLSIVKVSPKKHVGDIPPQKLDEIIAATRAFSKQFYRWRKKFVLRKHLKAHRKSTCPHCGTKLIREKTGKRQRWSYWCPLCQPY